MLEWIDPSSICRNEFCTIEELHSPHDWLRICGSCRFSWVDDEHCPKCNRKKSRRIRLHGRKECQPRSNRPPWVLPAPVALDEAILRSVSDVVPRNFSTIINLIENDFGSLGDNRMSGMRRVHRRIRILTNVGSILRIEVWQRMFAYLKPTSRIARDVEFIRDLMADVTDAPGGYYKNFERAA